MNTQQLENLKGLIKSSPILSSQERQEWNTLLDLMDDKQLSELQKILSTAKPAPAVVVQPPKLPTPKVAPLPNLNEKLLSSHTEPLVQPKPQQPTGATQVPKLSHIVNLPKSFGSETVKPKIVEPIKPTAQPAITSEPKSKTAHELLGLNKQVTEPVKPIVPPVITPPVLPAEKKENKFLAKLKSILAEKELPPGKPQEVTPKPILRPLIKLEVKKGPEIPQPKVIVAEKVSIQAPPAKPEPVEQKVDPIKELLKQAKPEVVIKSATPTPNKAPISELGSEELVLKKPQFEHKAPSAVGGLAAFSQPSQQEKETIISELKERLEEKKNLENAIGKEDEILKSATPEVKSQTGKPSNIEKLEDLTTFTVKTLNESDFQSMVKKIRALISKTGYHTVLFNLEQSSVFKAYLKTGSEILNNQATFEQIQIKTGTDYLNRRSFEAFTDLLRQIQVG